ALAAGITRVAPDTAVRRAPVADGGDGTVEAFVAAGWESVSAAAVGPTGRPVRACYARRGDTAVIELAEVAGLVKLPGGRLDPLGSDTYGVGLLIRHALDRGIRDIVLGLGGSASSDGGAGMLRALGARITDAAGAEVSRGGAALAAARSVDLTGLHPALAETTVLLASDVDNALLGPSGAVAVFGGQKGAGALERAELEAALTNWARLIGGDVHRPGAGAAGGTGFAALAVLGARVRPGIEVVLELIDFPALLRGADRVITGEGAMDEQTLRGKAPAGVAAAARSSAIPVLAVAGRLDLSPDRLRAAGFLQCYALTDLEPDPDRCIAGAAGLLEELGARLARDHLR
ncbi:MAG: glycerate kinase, partial [Nocardia sp.]|nr:glycerate kinase [Nocardia sp.]